MDCPQRIKEMNEIYGIGRNLFNWDTLIISRAEGIYSLLRSNGVINEQDTIWFPSGNKGSMPDAFNEIHSGLVIAGDIVFDALKYSKFRNKMPFVCADAFYAPFKKGSIDIIVDILGALWYAGAKEMNLDLKLLQTYYDVLSDKGKFIVDSEWESSTVSKILNQNNLSNLARFLMSFEKKPFDNMYYCEETRFEVRRFKK